MEERKVRDDKIQAHLSQILSPEGLKTEGEFESLCMYFHDDDINTVYKSLTRRGDSQSIHWLVRYLVSVERPSGFEKLFLLLQSENEFIREEATSGITKIAIGTRIELLIRMLDLRWERQISVAAEQLGKLRISKAVIPMLEVLERKRENENISMSIVRALGNIGDRQSFIALERLAGTAEGNILEEVLLSLGKLTRTPQPLYLKRYLSSKNIRIREITYHAMAMLQSRRGEYYLARGLSSEDDEALKINILSWINTIKTRRLFWPIFDLALNDSSLEVNMMAQSAIKRAKSANTLRYLIREEPRSAGRAKSLVLRLLTDYRRTSSIVKIFERNYSNSSEKLVKLIAVESLGQIRDKSAIPFLMKIVKEQNEYSLVASISLSYLTDDTQWETVAEILSLDEIAMSGAIQIFLRLILRLPADYPLPEVIERHIERLTASNSPHIRYLAVRCSARARGADIANRLFSEAQSERSLAVRMSYIRSLVQILQNNSGTLIELLSQSARAGRMDSFYHKLFKDVAGRQVDFDKIVKKLLELIVEAKQRPTQRSVFYIGRLMVFLKIKAEGEKASFLDYLVHKSASDSERQILMRILNTTDIYQFGGLSIDFMAGQYKDASSETKVEYLNFFKRMSVRNRMIEDVVFDDLHREDDDLVKKRIDEVVSRWIWEGKEGMA